MSLTYYPSEGGINKVGLTEDGEWFGTSTGGKLISKIKNIYFKEHKDYFDFISAKLNEYSKWFLGNITEYNFITGKSIYRCLYIGNDASSNGILPLNNINVEIFSNDVPNISNYITVKICTDGVFTEYTSKNSTVLQREDDAENILLNRNDWTNVIDTSNYNNLKPGEFYKVWLRISFSPLTEEQVRLLFPENFTYFIKIKNLILPSEKIPSRLSYSKIFKTNLYNSFDKQENNFIFREFFKEDLKINTVYKILENNDLINIFYWNENEEFYQSIIKPHNNLNKVKILNIKIDNLISKIVKNDKNNKIVLNICNQNQQEEDINNYKKIYYNIISPEKKIKNKYLLNIFSSHIDGENYFYIFYNQYDELFSKQETINYGYQKYILNTYVYILNLSHINNYYFNNINNNITELKFTSIEPLNLNSSIISINKVKDLLFGVKVNNSTCDENKKYCQFFYLLEKDLIFNKIDLHHISVPKTLLTSFKNPLNKVNSNLSLKFIDKNVNLMSLDFFRKIKYFDNKHKISYIYMGPPHQKAFHHGLSPVSFDWNEEKRNDYSVTYAFGFDEQSLLYQKPKEENCVNEFTYQQGNSTNNNEINSGIYCSFENSSLENNEIKNIFIFYNDSHFDNYTKDHSILDFNAIDYHIKPLLYGGSANVDNYSKYTKGINGIFIDILTVDEKNISLNDFEFYIGNDNNINDWQQAPLPTMKIYDHFYDNNLIKRIAFIWNNDQIKNTWLKVIIKNNTRTKLNKPFVFFFGHLTGAITGTKNLNNQFIVSSSDVSSIQNYYNNNTIAFKDIEKNILQDINKDGIVDINDLMTVSYINYYSQLYPNDAPFLHTLNLSNYELLYVIKNKEDDVTYFFDEDNPTHWHLSTSFYFDKNYKNFLKLPHYTSYYNVKNQYIPIFSIKCVNSPESSFILKTYYNFNLLKWKIIFFNNQLQQQEILIDEKNFYFTAENVISFNISTKNVYGCIAKKEIGLQIICNNKKLFYGASYSLNENDAIIIEHNPDSMFSGWISFYEIRNFINEHFEKYAYIMHRIYSNIAWFSLSEEKENKFYNVGNKEKYLYRRYLEIHNCNKFTPHEEIIVPLVIQGTGYNVDNTVNNNVKRSTFDFSKIEIHDPNFLFTLENSNIEIPWYAEKYNIDKDILVVWLKLNGWNGQKIIMHYGNKTFKPQKTNLNNIYTENKWYSLWDMTDFSTVTKHRYINSNIFASSDEFFITLNETEQDFYIIEILNYYLFGNINVYKNHKFDLLIDDSNISRKNLEQIKAFIKENIRDFKPSISEIRNIDSVYNYITESNSNNKLTRPESNDPNIIVPPGGYLPLCQK